MPNLRCHDTTCLHNHAGCCGKDEIQVSATAKCESYDFDTGKNLSPMEFAEEIANSNCMTHQHVCCDDTNCKNNADRSCSLDNLRVDRIDGKPLCVNERPKDNCRKCGCKKDNY